ncbi:hypothetical protein OOK36_29895 [Streptomyces sp. NBC_00365]|uniref:hypothetical protein n=1 Tax=Streptomyces sp. NBC_00365 TaxID=2975726 RepID=UPI0022518A14|nr:hypothetical protein [Streptomyces sp. NBC_00365]MCX5093025.1 hypothetical protein [Streptomyces sp. NBC_00365]
MGSGRTRRTASPTKARTLLAFVDAAEVVPPPEVRAEPAGTAAAIGAAHGGGHAPHAGS